MTEGPGTLRVRVPTSSTSPSPSSSSPRPRPRHRTTLLSSSSRSPSSPSSPSSSTTSSSSSSSSSDDDQVPVIFHWRSRADRALLSGSWDDYATSIPLATSSPSEHSALLYLPPGSFSYRFRVDGRDTYDPSLPHCPHSQTNTLTVHPLARTFDFNSLPPSSPVSSYSQLSSASASAASSSGGSDPPAMPPHLEARMLKPLPDDVGPGVARMTSQHTYTHTHTHTHSYTQAQAQAPHHGHQQQHYPSRPGTHYPHHQQTRYPEPPPQQYGGGGGGGYYAEYGRGGGSSNRYGANEAYTGNTNGNENEGEGEGDEEKVKRIRPFYSHVFVDHLYESRAHPTDHYSCMSQSCRVGSKLINVVLVVNNHNNHMNSSSRNREANGATRTTGNGRKDSR